MHPNSFRRFSIWLALCLAVSSASAQAPATISYQGRLAAFGTNFNGPGWLKFALVNSNASVTYWSNDGSSLSGSQPLAGVSNLVQQGLVTVLLGDSSQPNMVPIGANAFTNPDVFLRIWFSPDASQYTQLSPDQPLAAAPFAMTAATVANGAITAGKLAPGSVSTAAIATGAVTAGKIGFQAVTTSNLVPGSITTAMFGQQVITAPNMSQGSVTVSSLASQAVTTFALADGSVTAAKLASGTFNGSVLANGSISQSKLNFQLGYINAKNPPYGAVGDGTNDDTAAIQNALNDTAAAGGGIVYLPRGNYLINSHLVIPAQTSLVGVWRAVTASSQNLGTTLLAIENAGTTNGAPFINVQGPNSTLEGVTIFYPNQIVSANPTPYPWCIGGGGGENITIQNVMLVNPYRGIDLATHGCPRHLVRFVFGQPLLTGIAVDQTYDIGRIMDIHFWPFWTQDSRIITFQNANAITFDFMRSDWEIVENVFSWGYNIGMRFRASANGSMNGQMSDINFDNVDIGLQCLDTQTPSIHISNLNLANAGGGTNHIGIMGSPGNAWLNVNNASFWGSFKQPVYWNNSGLFSLSNARFLQWDPSKYCVEIVTGRAILQGNFFTDNVGLAIYTHPTVDRVMVLGNMLVGNTTILAGGSVTSANNQP